MQHCAHTCPPPLVQNGNHQDLFLLHLAPLVLLFDLFTGWLAHKLPEVQPHFPPLSLKWARRPLFLPLLPEIFTRLWNQRWVKSRPAAGEQWDKPKLCQDSLQAIWKSLQCVMFLYTVLLCACVLVCVCAQLVELLSVPCVFWLQSFFGLRQLWKLGSTYTCHYKTLKLYSIFPSNLFFSMLVYFLSAP